MFDKNLIYGILISILILCIYHIVSCQCNDGFQVGVNRHGGKHGGKQRRKLEKEIIQLEREILQVNDTCNVGDTVKCPEEGGDCAGNQCCPDGSTCPSAQINFSGCPKSKMIDCTKHSLTCMGKPSKPFTPPIDKFIISPQNTYNANTHITLNTQLIINGTLCIDAAFTIENGGYIEIAEGGNLNINNGGWFTISKGGKLKINKFGTLIINKGGHIYNSGDVTNGGSITNENGGTITNGYEPKGNYGGSITNKDGGSITNKDGAMINNYNIITNKKNGMIHNRGAIILYLAGKILNRGKICGNVIKTIKGDNVTIKPHKVGHGCQ